MTLITPNIPIPLSICYSGPSNAEQFLTSQLTSGNPSAASTQAPFQIAQETGGTITFHSKWGIITSLASTVSLESALGPKWIPVTSKHHTAKPVVAPPFLECLGRLDQRMKKNSPLTLASWGIEVVMTLAVARNLAVVQPRLALDIVARRSRRQ